MRYFIALPLPDEVRDWLSGIQPPDHPGIRLIQRDEFHVTLHFVGHIETESLSDVTKRLSRFRMPRCTVALDSHGTFQRRGAPFVLWAGVRMTPELQALHCAIGVLLTEAIGFQPEQRSWTPHVTLARIRNRAGVAHMKSFLSDECEIEPVTTELNRVVLFSSDLSQGGPVYREVAAATLAPVD